MTASVVSDLFGAAERAAFAELDLVRVIHAVVTEEGEVVVAGSSGTVVAVHDAGQAYEVRFDAGVVIIDVADLVAA